MKDHGFTVPQSYCRSDTHNVFSAAIGGPMTLDWVALCSKADSSRIVIFWDGRPDSTTELDNQPNVGAVRVNRNETCWLRV